MKEIVFASEGAESWCHKGILIVPNIKCLDYLLPLINPSKVKNLYLVCLSLGQQRKTEEVPVIHLIYKRPDSKLL